LKQVSNDETKFIIQLTLLHRLGSKYWVLWVTGGLC
jgi:predicted RNase H-related nuclease YkuK (DUF458 family)